MTGITPTRRGFIRGITAAIALAASPITRAAAAVLPRRLVVYPEPFLPFGIGAWRWAGWGVWVDPLNDDSAFFDPKPMRQLLADLSRQLDAAGPREPLTRAEVRRATKQLKKITVRDLIDPADARAFGLSMWLA
jgi:hypothetical protein